MQEQSGAWGKEFQISALDESDKFSKTPLHELNWDQLLLNVSLTI